MILVVSPPTLIKTVAPSELLGDPRHVLDRLSTEHQSKGRLDARPRHDVANLSRVRHKPAQLADERLHSGDLDHRIHLVSSLSEDARRRAKASLADC